MFAALTRKAKLRLHQSVTAQEHRIQFAIAICIRIRRVRENVNKIRNHTSYLNFSMQTTSADKHVVTRISFQHSASNCIQLQRTFWRDAGYFVTRQHYRENIQIGYEVIGGQLARGKTSYRWTGCGLGVLLAGWPKRTSFQLTFSHFPPSSAVIRDPISLGGSVLDPLQRRYENHHLNRPGLAPLRPSHPM